MGKGGKKKMWPTSWQRAAIAGRAFTLKGRSFAKEYAVVPLRVEAGPRELEERLDVALAVATLKQRQS